MARIRIDHPWIDETEAPLYRLAYPAATNDAELQAYYDRIDAWAASLDGPVAWVVDTANLLRASPVQRKLVSEREGRLAPVQKRFYCGSALVAKSALSRGIITAVFWMAPPPYPYQVFDDEAEALAWARGCLAAAK